MFLNQIRPMRLPETCAGCQFNNDTDCQQDFHAVWLDYDCMLAYAERRQLA